MDVKRVFLVFVLLFALIGQTLAVDNLNSEQYLKLNITNNISFGINFTNFYSVNNFDVNSFFFPRTFTGAQYLNDFNTNYKRYVIKNNSENLYIDYSLGKKNLSTNNKITSNFIVESTIYRPQIKEKIAYPIKYVSSENEKYLKFSGLINTNENIKNEASSLAEGQDDVFVIASKIAEWITKDVNYNLSTITQDPNQSSTDVFVSKAGVCKEITNLYVSMMRSIGIPARVVSGYAYTNSKDVTAFVGSNWAGHAWAEVLIGNTWVPFDLTYNEFGYIDPTHIILDKSAQSTDKSVLINATGYGFNLIQGSLKVKSGFKVLAKKNNLYEDGINVKIEGPKRVNLESYGYLKVSLTNTDNFYKTVFLNIVKTKNAQLLDSSEKMVILLPNEQKIVYFKYKLFGLNPDLIYTLPFDVYYGSSRKEFNVSAQRNFITIKESELPNEQIQNKIYTKNKIMINCSYTFDVPENIIMCSVKNPNNYEIKNLNVCIKESCKKLDLGLSEEKIVSFETKKFNQILAYASAKETGSLNLELEKPVLILDKRIKGKYLLVNYTIKNYNPQIKLNIYLNNELLKSFSTNTSFFKIPLSIENNSIRDELLFKNKKFYEEDFNITINKTLYETLQKQKITNPENLFEKIFRWILGLFRNR